MGCMEGDTVGIAVVLLSDVGEAVILVGRMVGLSVVLGAIVVFGVGAIVVFGVGVIVTLDVGELVTLDVGAAVTFGADVEFDVGATVTFGCLVAFPVRNPLSTRICEDTAGYPARSRNANRATVHIQFILLFQFVLRFGPAMVLPISFFFVLNRLLIFKRIVL